MRKDIREFISTIPSNVTIVAASKYYDVDEIRELYNNGISDFGENRVESFLDKYNELSDLNITWHFIGHLQRNKALRIIDEIDYLHSLDSLLLAEVISAHRLTPLKCFVEVSVNHEDNKNGVTIENTSAFIKELLKLPNIKIVGLMMMALKGANDCSLCKQFAKLRTLKESLENEFSITLPYLSMGMSEDYLDAIKEGATHVRLGRILAGDLPIK